MKKSIKIKEISLAVMSLFVFGVMSGQKNYSNKHLKNADEYAQVHNYSKAIEGYKQLTRFKKDKEDAYNGLVWCFVQLKRYDKLDSLMKVIDKEQAVSLLLSGIQEERSGKRKEAKDYYEKYLEKVKEKSQDDYRVSQLKDYAEVAIERLSEIKEKTTGKEDIKITPTTNTDIKRMLMGITVIDTNIMYSMADPGNLTSKSRLTRISGYKGSLSSDNSSNIESNYYLGGFCVDKNTNEVYISKTLYEDVGFGEVSKKKYKELKLNSEGINPLQIFKGKDKGNMQVENLEVLSFCDVEYNYIHPVLFNNGKKMIFSSNMSGTLGGYDLYIVEKQSDNSWGAPRNLGEGINSKGDEIFPFVVNDTVLYYSSNGMPGYGNSDIFYSLIKKNEFMPAVNMGPQINSSYDEVSLMMLDKRRGLFFSNRENGVNEKILYIEYPIRYRKIKGRVKDKLYNQPLSEVSIKIYDGDSLITSLTSNEIGKFNYDYLYEDKPYRLYLEKNGYKPLEKKVRPGNTEIVLDWDELAMEPIIEKKTVFRFNNILFDLGKADLKDSSKVILDRVAELLISNPNVKVELSAHTDSRSSASYNMKLSGKRAQSCVNYLISKGVKSENLVSKGYGESKLLNRCKDGVKCSEEEHAINRRVEIRVLDIK